MKAPWAPKNLKVKHRPKSLWLTVLSSLTPHFSNSHGYNIAQKETMLNSYWQEKDVAKKPLRNLISIQQQFQSK